MPDPQQPSPRISNAQTILFMIILSFVCALILSILASALAKPKEIAKELDRSKQMMVAAKILDHNGHFIMRDAKGEYIPAKYVKEGIMEPGSIDDIATQQQLIEVFKTRLIPFLVNDKGDTATFKQTGLDEPKYIADNRKNGYYRLPWKLIYKIMPPPTNDKKNGGEEPEGYVIPVNGFGLWDAIYGYIAIKPNADTVIGISWYDQKETPGLGGNIAEASWQNLFPAKRIFQASPDGKTQFKNTPLGIVVVKGKVAEVLGDSAKAKSAVDGMTGATLTGNGVTDAYRDVLGPYRPFLIKLHDQDEKSQKVAP